MQSFSNPAFGDTATASYGGCTKPGSYSAKHTLLSSLGRFCALKVTLKAQYSSHSCVSVLLRENNFGAQALYTQLDFEKAGVRKGYYTDTGEAAYIMWNSDIGLTLSKSNVSIG